MYPVQPLSQVEQIRYLINKTKTIIVFHTSFTIT